MEITQRQIEFISIIEEVLNINFNGKTKEEANRFISDNIKAFKLQQELDAIDNFTVKY